MDGTAIKALLKNINITTSTDETGFIQIPELKAITTTNNGEHFTDYHTDLLNFDFSNELLKVKQYDYRFINKHIPFVSSTGNRITFKRLDWARINPDDYLYFINADTRKIIEGTYTIKSVSENTLETNEKLNLPNATIYMYLVPKEDYSTSQIDVMDIRQRYITKPISNHVADVYIGFDCIQGFRFN